MTTDKAKCHGATWGRRCTRVVWARDPEFCYMHSPGAAADRKKSAQRGIETRRKTRESRRFMPIDNGDAVASNAETLRLHVPVQVFGYCTVCNKRCVVVVGVDIGHNTFIVTPAYHGRCDGTCLAARFRPPDTEET